MFFFPMKFRYLVVSKKRIHYLCEDGIGNPPLVMAVCHQSASLVVPNSDPWDRIFYLTLTLMIDS